jgi:hypothetical protein
LCAFVVVVVVGLVVGLASLLIGWPTDRPTGLFITGNASSESDQEAKTKKRKRPTPTKHDSEEEENDGEGKSQNASSPVSPKQATKKGKANNAGEDLGEAVSRKDLSGKKTANTPPQTKKRRVSTDASASSAGSTPHGKEAPSPSQQAKALGGFKAFNQMKTSATNETPGSKDEVKQKAAVGASESPVANGGRTVGDDHQSPRKATIASPQGKAKEVQKDDAMEQEEDGFDFARMSIDDLFAQFDAEGKAKSGADRKTKNENPKKATVLTSPTKAKAATPKEKKPAPVVQTKPAETMTDVPKPKAVEPPTPVDIQPIIQSTGTATTAATIDGATKKKRRRRRGKNAANAEANGTNTDDNNTRPEQGSTNGTLDEMAPGVKTTDNASGQKRKREEQKENAVEETKKHKADDAVSTPAAVASPIAAKSANPEDHSSNGNSTKKEKAVVGSGKNDKVLSFDDLVFRRGGKGKDLVDSSPLGKGKKTSDGAKEWEQYLKLNTKENQLETKNGTHLTHRSRLTAVSQ